MITINITYYNEPKWLQWWYDTTKQLYEEGHAFKFSICDDGSMNEPATKFFESNPPLPFMSLYRVTKDIGFNSHGARNLLVKQTTTDWNMMSDIDRHYSIGTFERLFAAEPTLQKGHYYSFYEVKKASADWYSVNEYVVHREDFWKTGGYDEEFVNIHWGDRMFLDTLKRVAKRECMREWEVKYVRGARTVSWEDVPTTIYPDDSSLIHPNNRWPDPDFRFNLKETIRQRNKTHEGRMSKKVINFEWARVF